MHFLFERLLALWLWVCCAELDGWRFGVEYEHVQRNLFSSVGTEPHLDTIYLASRTVSVYNFNATHNCVKSV